MLCRKFWLTTLKNKKEDCYRQTSWGGPKKWNFLHFCTYKTIRIARIHFTIRTVGITSFSMYGYSTQPIDGIPTVWGYTQAKRRWESQGDYSRWTLQLSYLLSLKIWSSLIIHSLSLCVNSFRSVWNKTKHDLQFLWLSYRFIEVLCWWTKNMNMDYWVR